MTEAAIPRPPESDAALQAGLAAVREALEGLRFGSIVLTVHEARVVQIDVTHKRRLRPT